MRPAKVNSQGNINDELEFRLWFKKRFGLDYIEAKTKLKSDIAETERKWNQLLIKHDIKI